MGPPASDRVTRVRSYSGSTLHLVHFAYGTFTPCGLPFQASSAMNAILDECPQPHGRIHGLASFPFARRYSGNRCFFLFLRVLRCFSSPGCLLHGYVFTVRRPGITLSGFPHSDICGLTDICSSPQLFAACHVLLRLPVPRHSPCALSCLTFFY